MSELPQLPHLPTLDSRRAPSRNPVTPTKPSPRHPYTLAGKGRTLGEMLPSLGELTGYPNGIGGPRA